MRKFYTFLMALVAFVLSAPSASAQEMIGSVVDPSEIADGLEVVFDSRSGTTSAGHYLFPFELSSGKTNTGKTINSILDFPEDIVFVLVKSEVKNQVTGLDQYYIKNRSTGKYLNFDWDNPSSTSRTVLVTDEAHTWVNDTASAKAFCIISNADDTWKGSYGSNAYGSSQCDWDASTFAVTYIFPAGTNTGSNRGDGWGRIFLANEFEVSGFNLWWFGQYQDTNVWDIRKVIDRSENPSMALEALVDTYKANVDTYYKDGTDPGFVTTELYNNFYEIYSEVLAGLGSFSDAEANTKFEQLFAAKTAIDAEDAYVHIEDGAYYYIKTAYTAFTTADNGNYAWYAPYDYTNKNVGWKALDSLDNRFIWQVKLWDDPDDNNRHYYSFYNVGANVYLGKASSHTDGYAVNYTNTAQQRIFAANLDRAGQFNIGSKYDYYDVYPPRPFHMNGHASGAGTEGTLVIWDGGLNSASAWYIHKVPQEVLDQMASNYKLDSLRQAITEYDGLTSGAQVGEGLGYAHSQEVIDNVTNALAKATEVAAQSPKASDAEIDAALTELQTAAKVFNEQVNTVPDGYYTVKSNYAPYRNNWHDIYFALYNDTMPGWKHYEESAEYLWKITRTADGNYTIQNAKNGMYLDKTTDGATNGTILYMTSEPTTPQTIKNYSAGIWLISNTEASDNARYYDPNGHSSGQSNSGRLHIWTASGTTSGVAWTLEPVTDENAAKIIANQEQNERNIALKSTYAEGRAAYNTGAGYTTGDAIITSVDQIYANNWSTNEGMHLEYMIDGNKDSYWNSTWEGAGTEQTPSEPHLLRFYSEAGFPDKVLVKTMMRQHSTWHRTPSHIRVEVSNDASGWKTLPVDFEPADFGGVSALTSLNTGYISYVVNGLKDYKYVRFVTQANVHSDGGVYTNNTHFMMDYAEFNMYPITGVDPNCTNEKATRKPTTEELAAALDAAYTEIEAGAATQTTLDRLTAALKAFNGLASNDSLIAMARYNVENLTSGDRIGEFPDDDLYAYQTTVEPLLEKIDDASTTAAEMQTAIAGLRTAWDALYPTMNKPAQDVWYLINTADSTREGYSLHAGGPSSHAEGNGYSYVLTRYSYEETSYNHSYHQWVLNYNEDGRVEPQNVGSGAYFGPYTGSGNTTYNYRPICWYKPMAFTIVPFGDGQVGFLTAEGYYVKNNASWLNYGCSYTKANDENPAFKGSGFAWTVQTTEEAVGDFQDENYNTYSAGSLNIVTLTYDAQNPIEFSNDDLGKEEGYAYALVGKVSTDEGDSVVTAYYLKQIDDEVIKAGVPRIYITPGTAGSETSYKANISPVLNTPVNAVRDTVNGLISVPATWTVSGTVGVFSGDSVTAQTSGTITNRTGYIAPYLVKNIADEYDVVVYVKGAGMLNGIKKAEIVAIKKFVNVYTTDGILVKKNVEATKATEGLAKGVYLIGKDKVLVK